jgi:uncharacterized SAM-dependent methyltransferase
MLTVDVLQTEDDLTREFLAALDRRVLPEKFFYWFPTSVRAWLALCADGAYRNFVRSQTLLQDHAAAVVSRLPEGDVTVVSLGAGQGVKDLILLEQLRATGRQPYYVPLDSSQALLEMACGLAEASGVSCRGVKADLADPRHLAALDEILPAAPRLVMLVGNTLGAFEPAEYCGRLACLLRPQDRLLVDGELFSETGTLPGYDNPLNRRFAFGPLRGLGLCEPDDGVLRFEIEADGGLRGFHRLRKHFVPDRDLTLTLAGEALRWRAGERIEMNWSGKFAPETFQTLLDEAGFATVERYTSADGQFVMALARRV